MPLDIIIDTGSDKEVKPLRLFIEDYDVIMEILEGKEDFHIMKRIFLNYYGDSEVYLDEFMELKQEVTQFKTLVIPERTVDFLKDFLGLIEAAERKRCTVKLIGD